MMKKILLTITFLVLTISSIFAAYSANEIVVLELNGDTTNTGSVAYTFTNISTTFRNDVLKYGSWSADFQQNTAARITSDATISEDVEEFQCWVYIPTGARTDGDLVTIEAFETLSLQIYLNSVYVHGSVIGSYPAWGGSVPNDTWTRINLILNGTNAYGYIDGVQQWTDTIASKFPAGKYWEFGAGMNNTDRAFEGYISRIILSTTNYSGSEIGYESPTITETWTITETITETPTITETETDTVTETVTPTITETITPTMTPTRTPYPSAPSWNTNSPFGTEIRGYYNSVSQVAVHHNWKTELYNVIATDGNGAAFIKRERNAFSVTFTAINASGTPVTTDIEYRIRK